MLTSKPTYIIIIMINFFLLTSELLRAKTKTNKKLRRNDMSEETKKLKLTTETENPFELVSEEILFAVLDNLGASPPTLRAFSAACRSFHSAESRHRRVLRPLRADLLPRTARRYPQISRLDLTLCPLVDDAALSAAGLAWSASLRSVDLSRSRSFSAAGLAAVCRGGLAEIDLSNGVDLTDSAAKAVAEAAGLERLRLARCKSVTDIGIGCIAVGCRKLKSLSVRWCLKISDLGIGLVAVKCKEIRSLDLSYVPITEKCLPSILELPHLEDLYLEGCYGIDDHGLQTLECSSKSLKMIDMANCRNVSYLGLSSLTYGAQSLEWLILSNGPPVSTDLAKCLRHFSGLQSIKLDGCVVTSSGINAIGNWTASLAELSLSKCSGLTDESLSFLAQKHKGLRKLDITCCRKITYESIDEITKSCTNLASLKMESCSLVLKPAFVLIGQRCRLLEELDLTDNEIDDEGLKAMSSCLRLHTLKLGVCLNITDEGLIHVGKSCSKLKELDLYRCLGITDAGITSITDGCPAMEMINIAYNRNITDSSLISLSKCSLLKELEIRACSRVSSAGLSAIAAGCRQLAVLDIKKCVNINNNAMRPLAQFCQNLDQINLSYCSVTDVGLLSVTGINRLRNMTILHLTGLTPNGLAAALLTSGSLRKVKLHRSFRPLLPEHIFKYMEARGCVFHWRDKAFQAEIDPKGRQLQLERQNE